MANKILNTKIALRSDSTANWNANSTVVLLKGEVGIEMTSDNRRLLKVGDGTTTWANLKYVASEALSKTVNPTSSDSAYEVGTIWVNTTNNKIFILTNKAPVTWTDLSTVTIPVEDVTFDGTSVVNATTKVAELTKQNTGIAALETNVALKANAATGLTGSTKTKITYNAEGIVTAGSDLAASDIPDLSTTYVNVNQKGVANGVATLDANVKVPVAQIPDLSNTYINVNQKAAANGVATLDENSKVPINQIPDAILGQMLFGGSFDSDGIATITNNLKSKLGISDNTIQLINSATDDTTVTPKEYGYKTLEGVYFLADDTFTIAGTTFNVGDWLVGLGTKWGKIDNTDAVTGVKGSAESAYRTGNVSINATNIGLGNVDNTHDADKNVASAVNATNVTSTINGIAIGNIFETDGQTAKKATTATSATNVALTSSGNNSATITVNAGTGTTTFVVNNVANATYAASAGNAVNVNLSDNGSTGATVKIKAGTGTGYEYTVNNVANATYATSAGSADSVAAANITGTLAIGHGGTGQTSNGTAGQVLTSNGANPMVWTNVATGSTGNAIVKRDANGSFSANVVTANLSGTATNATQLNGQSAAYYTNASNINSGVLALGRGGTGTSLANGVSGQVLTSNGDGTTKWTTITANVTDVQIAGTSIVDANGDANITKDNLATNLNTDADTLVLFGGYANGAWA